MTGRSRTSRVWAAHALAVLALAALASQAGWIIATGRLASWGLGEVLFSLVDLSVGWLLAWRRPDISLGWIMIGIALFGALRGPVGLLADALAHAAPGVASWLGWYGGESQWSWIPPVAVLFTQVPLRFPDGRLPSPRWRWFSGATIVAIAFCCLMAMTQGRSVGRGIPNPTYVPGLPEDALGLVLVGLLFASFAGSMASLFIRYRRADAVERAQLKWVFWALTLVVTLLIVDWTESSLFGGDTAPGLPGVIATIGQIVTVAAYFLVPIAILVSVLRYGLFSIDRIVSRTAAYAIVTLCIVAMYAAIVLIGGLLLPKLPSVGVALATLAAAAVFLPLLRAVRGAVDRRFNRAQYDAAKVVDDFGERIRTGADPEGATADLVAAVERTLQPTAVGLWTADRS